MTAREATTAAAEAVAPLERPHLRGLPGGGAGRVATLWFAALIGAVLIAGTIGLLALNTYVQNQAFQLRDAQRAAAKLAFRSSDLQAQVFTKSAPGELAAQAAALGMVPNPYPVFINLATGQIVGTPKVVVGGEIPGLVIKPQALATPTISPVQSNIQPWIDLSGVAAPTASPGPQPSASIKPATTSPTKSPTASPTKTKQP